MVSLWHCKCSNTSIKYSAVGFQKLETGNIEEALHSHAQEQLTNKDLLECSQNPHDEEEIDNEEDEPKWYFNSKRVGEMHISC